MGTLALLLHAIFFAVLIFLIAVEDPAQPTLPDVYPKRSQREWKLLFFGLVTILSLSTTALATYSSLPRYFYVPALSVGLRRENVLISIPSEYIGDAAFCRRPQRVEGERGEKGGEDRVELEATLLFHGLGKRSLIEFDDGGCPPLTLRIRRVVVPFDKVVILDDSNAGNGSRLATT